MITTSLLSAAVLFLLRDRRATAQVRLYGIVGDTSICAARGGRAVDCGSGNPGRPDLCCEGLRCSARSDRYHATCWLPEDTEALGVEEEMEEEDDTSDTAWEVPEVALETHGVTGSSKKLNTRSAASAVAKSNSILHELLNDKQTYNAAWALIGLQEAVSSGAIDEPEARAVLDQTRYERVAFAAGGNDGETDVIPFVRGTYGLHGDSKAIGDLTKKSVGNHLSITAGLLIPLIWDGSELDLDKAKVVVLDLQLRYDETLGGSADIGFVSDVGDGALSFYRQMTTARPKANSGGSSEPGGWNPDNWRDEHKVSWQEDLAMGSVVACQLVEYYRDVVDDDEALRIGDTLYGLALGYDVVFADLFHAYDITLSEASPVRWTRGIGWGVYGVSLIRRTLAALGRVNDVAVVDAILISHLEKVLQWRDGLWWQHTDGTRGNRAPSPENDRNFIEVSGSALILAAMGELKRAGTLPESMLEDYDDGLSSLLNYIDCDGSIHQCSSGLSIGAKPAYYFSRGVDDPSSCRKAGVVLIALALSSGPDESLLDACADVADWKKDEDMTNDTEIHVDDKDSEIWGEEEEVDDDAVSEPATPDTTPQNNTTALEEFLANESFAVSYHVGFALFIFMAVILYVFFVMITVSFIDKDLSARACIVCAGTLLGIGTALLTWGAVAFALAGREAKEDGNHISVAGLVSGSFLSLLGGLLYVACMGALFNQGITSASRRRNKKVGKYLSAYVFGTFILLVPGLTMLAMYCQNTESVAKYGEYHGPMRITGWTTNMEGTYPPQRNPWLDDGESWKEYADVEVSWGMWWGCPDYSRLHEEARWCTDVVRDFDCTYCSHGYWKDRLRGLCRTGTPNAADCMKRKYGMQETNFALPIFDPQTHPVEDKIWPRMTAYGDCESCRAKTPIMLEGTIDIIPTVKTVGAYFVIVGASIYVIIIVLLCIELIPRINCTRGVEAWSQVRPEETEQRPGWNDEKMSEWVRQKMLEWERRKRFSG